MVGLSTEWRILAQKTSASVVELSGVASVPSFLVSSFIKRLSLLRKPMRLKNVQTAFEYEDWID